MPDDEGAEVGRPPRSSRVHDAAPLWFRHRVTELGCGVDPKLHGVLRVRQRRLLGFTMSHTTGKLRLFKIAIDGAGKPEQGKVSEMLLEFAELLLYSNRTRLWTTGSHDNRL